MGWFPRSLCTGRRGRRPAFPLQPRHGYAADLPRGLPPRRTWPSWRSPPRTLGQRALCPGPSARFRRPVESLEGVSPLVSALVRLPALRAGHRPSGRPGPSRRCQGCSHPHLCSQAQSGRTGGLPRRSPLRTARAAFTAGSSSKPQGRLRIEAPTSCVGEREARVGRRHARGGFGHRPVSRAVRGGRDRQRRSPCGRRAATSVPILLETPAAARRTALRPRRAGNSRPAW